MATAYTVAIPSNFTEPDKNTDPEQLAAVAATTGEAKAAFCAKLEAKLKRQCPDYSPVVKRSGKWQIVTTFTILANDKEDAERRASLALARALKTDAAERQRKLGSGRDNYAARNGLRRKPVGTKRPALRIPLGAVRVRRAKAEAK